MIDPVKMAQCKAKIWEMGMEEYLRQTEELFQDLKVDPVACAFGSGLLEDTSLTGSNLAINSISFGFFLGMLYGQMKDAPKQNLEHCDMGGKHEWAHCQDGNRCIKCKMEIIGGPYEWPS